MNDKRRLFTLALFLFLLFVVLTAVLGYSILSNEEDGLGITLFSSPKEKEESDRLTIEDILGEEESGDDIISLVPPLHDTSSQEEEAASPSAIEPVPSTPERYVVEKHTVILGDSFSKITGQYWEDYYLWPDLYVRNSMQDSDPDMILPDEVVDIYNRIGEGNHFTETERRGLLNSYIEVYNIYLRQGSKRVNARRSLLWTATKYNPLFLDENRETIVPDDYEAVKGYIAEKGAFR